MKKMAIVYDWIDSWGGIERDIKILHNTFPSATIYTSYADFTRAPWARTYPIRTSFIHHLPSWIRSNRILSLLLYPYAFESFDFSQYDVVLSISSSFAKGIITKPHTKHIAFILTPTRFLWVCPRTYMPPGIFAPLKQWMASRMRTWDYLAAQRPDKIVAVSNTVAERIRSYYHRTSQVIPAPFPHAYWRKLLRRTDMVSPPHAVKNTQPYYLIVSRLEQYKRVDIAIKAWNSISDNTLVIVGKGSQKRSLIRKARGRRNIVFIDSCSDIELVALYAHAQALIMPQEEDFGYVALEAQVCGCPIIAYRKGGVIETTIENKTALYFHSQNPYILSNCIKENATRIVHMKRSMSQNQCHLDKYNPVAFVARMRSILE